jgi:hypothetical protein
MLSRSTLIKRFILSLVGIYMLTTIFRTTTTRLAPTLRKSVLTATTATTVPSLAAGFSLFNLGNIASFGSMGRNDIANDEAPMDPKVVKPDTEWRAQLSPEQVGSRNSFQVPSCLPKLTRRHRPLVPSPQAKRNRSSRNWKVQQTQGRRGLQSVFASTPIFSKQQSWLLPPC